MLGELVALHGAGTIERMPQISFFRTLAAFTFTLVLLGCGGGGDSDADNALGPDEQGPPLVGTDLDRFRGVSLASAGGLPTAALEELVATGVEWIALIPFGRQPRFDVPEVQLRTTRGRWSQTDAGIRRIAEIAASAGVRILLKPHIDLVSNLTSTWWRK